MRTPLDFFNELSARLEIQLSEPTFSPGGLENKIATPSAEIVSVSLACQVYEAETETFRDLTDKELALTVLPKRSLVLRGEADIPVKHRAANGKRFTLANMIAAVEETERQTRGTTDWFDGIDVHHIFFEGIRITKRFPTVEWTIDWGS